MRRGTVCRVNLAPAHPPERGKTRPGVVGSSSDQSALLGTVVIVPLSSQAPEIFPLRIALHAPKAKRSFAVIPGIRQVSKRRIFAVIPSGVDETLLDENLALTTCGREPAATRLQGRAG